MCELLQQAMCSPFVGAREWKEDFDKRGSRHHKKSIGSSLLISFAPISRPRKIGFQDKDVAKEIHVSLAQLNIAVVHEQVQPVEIESVSRSCIIHTTAR